MRGHRDGDGSWRDWPRTVKIAIVFAFLSRLAFLGWKAPHFDEGINGHFVDQIWRNGYFRYDPTNFHGPLYFYLLHLAELALGRGIETFRFLTGLISAGGVALAAMHARYLGRAAFWAAGVLAVSPAFLFYGRYAIHETLLIFGQLAFSYGFLRLHKEGGAGAVAWLASSFVITFATKETFFIFYGTWAIAWAMLRVSERAFPPSLRSGAPWPTPLGAGGRGVWAWAGLIAVAAVAALFSGFFAFPRGLRDMLAAFAFWAKTGTGATGHEKPFFYWVELLWRYEWPALLALAASPVACLFGSLWMRLYALVGFGLWLAYSLIPYKTPWCIIGFVWPLAFAFGFLMAETRPKSPKAVSLALTVLAGVVLSASLATALRLGFRDFENADEPYVYVQTTRDVPQVMRILEGRASLEPQARAMRVQVLNKDSWPLPWLLARFPRAEFAAYDEGVEPLADVIFADGSDAVSIEKKLRKTYFKRPLDIRAAYQGGYAYFEADGFAPWFGPSAVRVGSPSPAGEGGGK